MKRLLIAANWKMNKTVGEAARYIEDFVPRVAGWDKAETVICPPFTCLPYLSEVLQHTHIHLGAQNIFWEAKGAFTGEISAAMLLDLHCRYVIVGHSERRQLMGESDEDVNRKLKSASSAGLTPIFCVGETLPEREGGRARAVVQRQLEQGLQGLDIQNLVIAYEPVWAIGTGLNASPADAQDMCGYIRNSLSGSRGRSWAASILILYGGSVTAQNIRDFVEQPDINGALVGGASLDPEQFARIVRLNTDA
ncbi:MAG: triose-phosphate isomerase [Syntrophomonadaceae bacterium]